MTIALTTRGIICHTGSSALSTLSWGQLCLVTNVVAVIGFSIPESLPDCTYTYNKNTPQKLGNLRANVLQVGIPNVYTTHSNIFKATTPTLLSSAPSVLIVNTRATVVSPSSVTLLDSKVDTLSNNLDPLLTSSGTKIPIIFDKDC